MDYLGNNGTLVAGRWRLKKRVGFGSFGDIYVAFDEQSGKDFAAKIEDANCRYPQLKLEYNVYKKLARYNGFPSVYWFGQADVRKQHGHQRCNCMIMDKLGDSLERLHQNCNRKFDIKTICMIGIQIINRIQTLHNEGHLHRDIKPDNFLIGAGVKDDTPGSVIHMIDMGLSKMYKQNGQHIAYRDGKRLTGTPRYCSINTHNGIEQSRRDDLESVAYMLIFFAKGKLPWQGLKGRTKANKYEQIRRKKIDVKPEELSRGLPEELCNFLVYIRKVEFGVIPDYTFLKKLLQLCCQQKDIKVDWRFQWQTQSNHTIDSRKKKNKKIDNEAEDRANRDNSTINPDFEASENSDQPHETAQIIQRLKEYNQGQKKHKSNQMSATDYAKHIMKRFESRNKSGGNKVRTVDTKKKKENKTREKLYERFDKSEKSTNRKRTHGSIDKKSHRKYAIKPEPENRWFWKKAFIKIKSVNTFGEQHGFKRIHEQRPHERSHEVRPGLKRKLSATDLSVGHSKRKASAPNTSVGHSKRKLTNSSVDRTEFNKRRATETTSLGESSKRSSSKQSSGYVTIDQYKELESDRDRYKRKCYEYEVVNKQLQSQLADCKKQMSLAMRTKPVWPDESQKKEYFARDASRRGYENTEMDSARSSYSFGSRETGRKKELSIHPGKTIFPDRFYSDEKSSDFRSDNYGCIQDA